MDIIKALSETQVGRTIRIIYSNKMLYTIYRKLYPVLPHYEALVFIKHTPGNTLKAFKSIDDELNNYGKELTGKKLDSGTTITGYEVIVEHTYVNRIHTILNNHLCLKTADGSTIVFSYGNFLYNENRIVHWQDFYSTEEIILTLNHCGL